MSKWIAFVLGLIACTCTRAQIPGLPSGYYRQPNLHDQTISFVSEGDIWQVPATGGVATRLTTHPGEEGTPIVSPDGEWLAFTGTYEGQTDVYVMPIRTGLPRRLTWDGSRGTAVVGWKDGRILTSTMRFSRLPSVQLTLIEPATGARELIPLAQASDGAFADDGTLFFTRMQFQGSHTKRYKGGTVQQLWRLLPHDWTGQGTSTPLTKDYDGTSTSPMWWNGRVYFASDRDGTMEVWSMNPSGQDLRQHTFHDDLDVKSPSMWNGRIVFQLGADIHLLDLASGAETRLAIQLSSDFDQMRERWVKKPMDYVTSAHLSPKGDSVVLTARGQIFVAPREDGRFVEVTRTASARHRDAKFLPGGESLLTLSDESDEVELWKLPWRVPGERKQLTSNGTILRWSAHPSPDGAWIAHHDKNQVLWLLKVDTGEERRIDFNPWDNVQDITWSSDSRTLAYVISAGNLNFIVKIYDVASGASTSITTDRFASTSPAFDPDGKWLYFVSERHLKSAVDSPWGLLQPEPFFDKRCKVYAVSLSPGTRWPFAPKDELQPPESKEAKKEDAKSESTPSPTPSVIVTEGIAARLYETPITPGNYSRLAATAKRLFWISSEDGKDSLMMMDITAKDPEAKVFASDVVSYELSLDHKSMLIRKKDALFIVDPSTGAPASLDKAKINLSGWTFSLKPREEFDQMYREAWRLMRDYFYDTKMHGTDWKSIRSRFQPLADRATTRAELNDAIAHMVGELSALHHFVRGGDQRSGDDTVRPGMLGALLRRDDAAGGFVIERIYQSDPDEPARTSPLARPDVNAKAGEVITHINGQPVLLASDPAELLRNQTGRQVLLTLSNASNVTRQVIVKPMSPDEDDDLRYHEWEYTRRLQTEQASPDIGYLHLRAMGSENMAEFAKGYFPVFDRKGLIIDVRHNRGGNIDSWILSRLLRKAWFFWQPRVGEPYWNMQYAFRGHVVVLCNERTASDGEAFAEGVKRLGIGTVIGTRTWGGEIWLSSSNVLVDNGIATASEIGVYGPEGTWLIEGHGVEPDIVIDNEPRQTFDGKDGQLEAAIEFLKKKIAEEPIDVPPAPPHPDKSFRPR